MPRWVQLITMQHLSRPMPLKAHSKTLRNTIGQQLLPVYKDLLDFGVPNLADGISVRF